MSREAKFTNDRYAVHEGVSGFEEAITPFFDTQEELINHLIENGTEWDEPISRKAAEEFVYDYNYVPSMVIVNGEVLRGLQSIEAITANKIKNSDK